MSPLARTLAGTILFVVALVVLLIVPKRGVEPLRESAFELDEPYEGPMSVPSAR